MMIQRGVRALSGRRSFFDKVGRNWDTAWEKQVTPWEIRSVNPSFVEGLELLESCTGSKNALVPGCGSGFDLLHLHLHGWNVTGLDISQKAVEIASINVQNDAVRLQQGDFFQYQSPEPYDLIYDYLFFAAIDPTMRVQCANQFHKLLRPQTGRLMTLLFPLPPHGQPKSTEGPPYVLSLEDYQEIFEPLGLELVSTHEPVNSIKPRKGRELLAFWSRQ